MGTFTDHLRDLVVGRPGDQMMGLSRNIRGALVKYVI